MHTSFLRMMLWPNNDLSLLKKEIVFQMQHQKTIYFAILSFNRLCYFDKKEFIGKNAGSNLTVYDLTRQKGNVFDVISVMLAFSY
jgi:hypothetical protein